MLFSDISMLQRTHISLPTAHDIRSNPRGTSEAREEAEIIWLIKKSSIWDLGQQSRPEGDAAWTRESMMHVNTGDQRLH